MNKPWIFKLLSFIVGLICWILIVFCYWKIFWNDNSSNGSNFSKRIWEKNISWWENIEFWSWWFDEKLENFDWLENSSWNLDILDNSNSWEIMEEKNIESESWVIEKNDSDKDILWI